MLKSISFLCVFKIYFTCEHYCQAQDEWMSEFKPAPYFLPQLYCLLMLAHICPLFPSVSPVCVCVCLSVYVCVCVLERKLILSVICHTSHAHSGAHCTCHQVERCMPSRHTHTVTLTNARTHNLLETLPLVLAPRPSSLAVSFLRSPRCFGRRAPAVCEGTEEEGGAAVGSTVLKAQL